MARGSMKLEIKRNIPGQIPLFLPPSIWELPNLNTLPSWEGAKRVAIDLETKDSKLKQLGPGVRRDGKIVGISFAIEDGPAHYLPIGHPEDNLPAEHVWNYINDQARVFSGDIVGANLQYELDYLWQNKIFFNKVKRYLDVQIAEPLIDDLQHSYSLQNILVRHGLPGKDETLLREAAAAFYVDPKMGIWQLPGRFVGAYATQDVLAPLALLRRQERIIEERNLWQVFNLETKLLPALVRMRRRGVAIDFKKLQEIEDWSIREQKKALDKVRELSGITLSFEDVNKAKALEGPLRTIANIRIGTCANGQPNIDKKLLESLKHPIADAILRARTLDKLRNSFVASVHEHQVNGRIHTTFNQLRTEAPDEDKGDKGARYGRMSSTDPNLQQQPSRDNDYDAKKKAGTLGPDDIHIGKYWRSIYIPDDGMKWAALDYSSQEPRMLVHYAALAKCTGAADMVAAYLANPNLDFHKRTAELTGLLKPQAKIVGLGRCYGMGGGKFAHSLGKPTLWVHSPRLNRMIEIAGPEAQAIIDRFDQQVPFVKEVAKLCEQRAGERGVVKTILGRQCHFPKKKDGTEGYEWTHKALNRVIQGSAGDQTKQAVVLADEAGEPMQLQVHDEIDLSVRDQQHAESIGDIMRNCVPLLVPSKVDVKVGANWGECKD
jgi:DNA polymerase I-like protein with 3'-5' exonuclease and polymerase domains